MEMERRTATDSPEGKDIAPLPTPEMVVIVYATLTCMMTHTTHLPGKKRVQTNDDT